MLPPAKLAIDVPRMTGHVQSAWGEIPSAAGYCIDRNLVSGPRAGRGGAERKISLAKPEIGGNLRSSAGSRCRRRKSEEHCSQADYDL